MSQAVRPRNSVVMMEDHDRAYHAWKERGVKNRTLVHIDAHIDFGWIPDTDMGQIMEADGLAELEELLRKRPMWNPFSKKIDKMMHIGNYICPAMREGIVDKFYWIVPDPTWRSARGRRALIKNLRWITKTRDYADKDIEVRKDRLSCRVFGKDIVVMPLSRLPVIDEPVLLDIDVDFMLTPFIWDDLNPHRAPWIFPEELIDKVGANINSIDMLTVAYSVNGGFTPIKYKYLGDELRARFEGPIDAKTDEICALRRQGSIGSYEKAIALDSQDPSLHFNLALLFLEKEDGRERAREHYKKAVLLDNSYAGAYNNCGIIFHKKNRIREAAGEFERFLSFDENNAHALNGLGYILLSKNRWSQAEETFNRVLALDAGNRRSLFGKALACFKTRRFKEAEEIFLNLTAVAPDDSELYWYLAKISAKKPEPQKTIDYYKKAVMAGGEGPAVHLELCLIYIGTGLYRRAREEIDRFLKLLLKDILDRCWT